MKAEQLEQLLGLWIGRVIFSIFFFAEVGCCERQGKRCAYRSQEAGPP